MSAPTAIHISLLASTALLGALLVPSAASSSATEGSAESWPTAGWEVSSPEDMGLDTAPLNSLVARAKAGGFRDLHSLLLVRNGRIVLEEYFPGGDPGQVHTMQSVSKSVAATLVGIAVQRGLIGDVTEPLLDFFPQYQNIEALDELKTAITLEDVLRMRSGFAWRELGITYEDPDNSLHQLNTYTGDWYRFVLDKPMSDPPGSRFLYNSGGAILLAGVVEHATGTRADRFCERYLFEPLGIEDGYWNVVNDVPHLGGGLAMKTRDMAKIGYLYLRDGVWEGERILPEGWTAAATTGPIEAPAPGQAPFGYGYMWWLLPSVQDQEKEKTETSVCAALGHMGQYILVAPYLNLVLVMTGGALDQRDENEYFDCLYDYVLPSADPDVPFVEPPPEDSSPRG